MIVVTTETIDGRRFTYTRSDAGMMIKQNGTGLEFTEALDPEGSGRTYTETDVRMEDV